MLHGNIISPGLFILNAAKNEEGLSWRAQCGPLRTVHGLTAYQAFHEFPYTMRGVGKRRYQPGLIRFTWFELLRLRLRPEYSPEDMVWYDGRDNPYWQWHYETPGEPTLAVRVRLSEMAADRIIAPCIEVEP